MSEPHSWDLCEVHGSRITAPKGWEMVRYGGGFSSPDPDDDDLTALAEAVREAGQRRRSAPHAVGADQGSSPREPQKPVAAAATASVRTGRRGHLRVLPDPS